MIPFFNVDHFSNNEGSRENVTFFDNPRKWTGCVTTTRALYPGSRDGPKYDDIMHLNFSYFLKF